jgi:hypothetical protein
MRTTTLPETTWTLGMGAWAVAVVGLFFFWVVPLGVIISLGAVVLGVAGWFASQRGAANRGAAISGTLFSLAVLGFNLVIATGGLDAVRDTFLNWLW